MKLEPSFKELAEKEKSCNGRVYRYRETMYQGKDGSVSLKHEYRLLRRKSCPGCVKCGWIEEYLSEDLSCSLFPQHSADLNAGELCTIAVIEESRDWESGVVDDVILGFVPYKEAL